METLALLRTLGGLGIVLGLLAGTLWVVRRYDIKLPGRITQGTARRVELVDRIGLDGRRSMVLVRRDGREHLILLAPEGSLVVESNIVRDETDLSAEEERLIAQQERTAAMEANAAAVRESFASLVDRARLGWRGSARPGRGDEVIEEDRHDA